MKKWLSILVIYSISVTCSFRLKGQEGVCGTQVTDAQIAIENNINLTSAIANESLQQLNMELAITVFIIKDEDGITGISNSSIQTAVDKLNNAFSPINLKFRICNTIIVENYQFNTISALNNEQDLLIKHYSPNTINLYFASDIIDANSASVSGFALMPSETKDAVFIDKDFIGGNDFIHQFGHFFNLYHTGEIAFGKELVKGTNCNKTGDKCCDTPADPFIAGLLDNKCDYTGNLKDSNKQFYIPSTNNFMSIGNGDCRLMFSPDQYNRIIYSVLNQKQHLW